MGKQRKRFLKLVDHLCGLHAELGLAGLKSEDSDQIYRYLLAQQLVNAALEIIDPTTEVHHGKEKAT